MKEIYLLTLIADDEVESLAFRSRVNAQRYIESNFLDYRKSAEDFTKTIECWQNHAKRSILLEKIKVED